jgi:mono/diheme cytochrome c family protein
MNFLIVGAFLGPLLFSNSLFAQTKALPSGKAIVARPVVKSDPATLEKGKRLFLNNCLQCHNRDPNMKGSIGPEIVDAPLEVMISKVMTGKYPEKLPTGFVPKRKSKAMRAIPKLKDDIPAIWAYVQSIKKKK